MDPLQWATSVSVGIAIAFVGVLILRRKRSIDVPAASPESARIDELRRQVVESNGRFDSAQDQIRALSASEAAAEARAEGSRRALEEQKTFWEAASDQMQNSFKALAADALRDSRSELVTATGDLVKGITESSAADLDARKTSIEQLVKPLRDAVDAYKQESSDLERRRLEQLGSVEAQYRELSEAAGGLRQETAKLANALRSPHVRGRWGQLTLRRSAELAGMVQHCDFYEQETVSNEERRLRPDMIVRLPSHRLIIVDSKVPMDAYLDAVDASDDQVRAEALSRHARQTRDHIVRLASKDYQAEFEEAPEFVVAFIPSDSILAAAVEADGDLVEFALSRGVVIATPATFFALLRAIAFGWRQEQVAENAQRLQVLGHQLAERLGIFLGHIEKVGGALRRAVETYNDAVGSFESRVLPSARLLRSYGVAAKELDDLEPIQVFPRSVMLPAMIPGAQELFPDDPESPLPRPDDRVVDSETLEDGDVDENASFTCHCRVCGEVFEGSGPRAQYCSERCREAGRAVTPSPESVQQLSGDDR